MSIDKEPRRLPTFGKILVHYTFRPLISDILPTVSEEELSFL